MKWLFRLALTLVTLVIVVTLGLLLVPADKIARLAADRFEAATGRALTIDGDVRATLWPRLGVRAEGITVANASWSTEGPMLRAEAMDIGVSLASILGDTVQVEVLEVERATLLLERRADGTGNWEFPTGPASVSSGSGSGAGTGPASAPTESRKLAIDRAILTGADITYVDRQADTTWRLRAVDMEARIPDLAGPVSVSGSALLGGVALTGEARVAALQSLLDGALVPVTLDVSAGSTQVKLDGRADLDPLSFDGRVDAASRDRFAMLQALGIVPPELPVGLGRTSVAISSAVTLAPAGSLHLRDMTLKLDGNTLSGAVDLVPGGERPRITGTLAATSLDLTGLSQKGQGGETALVSETGWGRETIDVAPLFAADGQLTFASGPITLGDATLDRVALGATIDAGRAVVTLQQVVAYGGTVTGEVVLNGRGGLSTRANLDLAGLQMAPFLTEFADFDRLIGQADVSMRLLGAGQTMQQIVESLDGNLAFKIGQGELLGLDIGGMIRNLDANFRGEGQKTIFDGVSASFAIADGIATGSDLSLVAPLLTTSGAGEINLGAQTLNYRLLPTLRRDAGSSGLTIPVLITGPWSNPRIRPDLEFLAKQRLEAEREELEARAREEAARLEARAREEAEVARARAEEQARAKLAAELEVAPEVLTDNGSLENAIKERVEEQLLDLLLNR